MLDDLRGDIEFREVYFAYPARPDEQIFWRFSLSIQSGMIMALVGGSGSGKSTIISLIERFYDPQGGDVLIDGTSLKEYNIRWIRRKIGLVSQEPVLFASSIRDNIADGKEDTTIEEISCAAYLANASNFIEKMPQIEQISLYIHGIDTMVGEHGTLLSGGQKQRIAIARAIIKDPRILLLDEATSALDTESEQVIQEALDRVMKHRTTVSVAHRLSTVRNADVIALLHQGQIVEKGKRYYTTWMPYFSNIFSYFILFLCWASSHLELLKVPGGVYCQLIHTQKRNQYAGSTFRNGDDGSKGSSDTGQKLSHYLRWYGKDSHHSFLVSFSSQRIDDLKSTPRHSGN